MNEKHFYLALAAISGVILLAITISVNYYESEKAKAFATITDPVTMCFAMAKTTEQQLSCTKLVK